MKPEHLDRMGLLAMTLYALTALSYYLNGFVEFGPLESATITAFLLLPPVWAGAGVYAIVRYRKDWGYSPRGLAAFTLGSGAATLLAWNLFLAVVIAYNRAFPPPDVYERGIGPVAFLVIPYLILCALLSVAMVVTLPKLVCKYLRDRPTIITAPEVGC